MVGVKRVWVIVLIAASELVLVLMAAIVEAVIDDVVKVELKILGAYSVWIRELTEVSEFVLILMAAIVEAVIDDVCRVLLKIVGVISEFWNTAMVPVVDPKILILLPKFATPRVLMFVEAVTLPIITVERPTNNEESAKMS
jgi:Mor family transcriptional regulator